MRRIMEMKNRIIAAAMVAFTLFATITSGVVTDAASYGGIGGIDSTNIGNGGSLAQVFTANADEQIKQVKMTVHLKEGQTATVTVKVFANVKDDSNPTGGVLESTSTALNVSYAAGNEKQDITYVLPDSDPVYVQDGEKFSVVANVTTNNNMDLVYYSIDDGTGLKQPSGEAGWNQTGSVFAVSTDSVTRDFGDDIQSISVTPTSVNADKSEGGFQIETTLNPALARTVTYVSSDSNVASVNSDGYVTYKGTGHAEITVSVDNRSTMAADISKKISVDVYEATLNTTSSDYDANRSGYVFNGTPVSPKVSLEYGGKALQENVNYFVQYSNNTQIGTATATVTGTGSYAGYSKTLEYQILSKEITQAMVDNTNFSVDKDTQVATVTEAVNKTQASLCDLIAGTDYTATAGVIATDAANGTITYQISVTGMGNYTTAGSVARTDFVVVQADTGQGININDWVQAELDKDTYTYDGMAKEPSVTFNDVDGNPVNFADNCSITYRNNTNAGTAQVIIAGLSNKGYTGTITKEFTIKKLSITQTDIQVGEGTQIKHTGESIRTTVVVKMPKPDATGVYHTLTEGTDYTLTYKNNKEIGTATVTVTAAANSNFSGSKNVDFDIIADLSLDAQVEIKGKTADAANSFQSAYTTTYNGTEQKPAVEVTVGGVTLDDTTDYQLGYANNEHAGTAKVIITGIGKYQGQSVEATFTIAPQSIRGANLNITAADKSYTGAAITLNTGEYALTKKASAFSSNTITYTAGSDYELTYENNVNAGTATVTATGINDYTGSVKATFRIEKLDITDAKKVFADVIPDQTYTGTAIKPTVGLYVLVPAETGGSDTVYLTENTDYTVTYQDNKNVGTASILVKGIGNLTGERTLPFNISPKTFTDCTITLGGSKCTLQADGTWKSDYTVVYDGEVQEPEVVIRDGNTTLQGFKDYTVSYLANVDAGTTAIARITGSGTSYGGTTPITVHFTIQPKDITTSKDIQMTVDKENLDDDANTTKNPQGYKVPKVSIVDKGVISSKQALQKKVDFVVEGTVGSDTAGSGKKATIQGIGNYTGSVDVEYSFGKDISAANVVLHAPSDENIVYTANSQKVYTVPYLGENTAPGLTLTYKDGTNQTKQLTQNTDYTLDVVNQTGTTQTTGYGYAPGSQVTMTINGTGDYFGTITLNYVVGKKSLADSDIIVTDTETKTNDPSKTSDFTYTYDGKTKTPQLQVQFDDGSMTPQDLVEGTDYQIQTKTFGSNAGTYKVTLIGIGDKYSGTREVTYTIEPADISDIRSTDDADNGERFTIAPVLPQVYTGNVINPSLTIVDTAANNAKLNQGTDYTIGQTTGYTNTNVGRASVTVTGKGNYTGTYDVPFQIAVKALSDVDASISAQVYTGSQIKPTAPAVTVTYNGSTLVAGTDYDIIAYGANTDIGTGTVTIEAKSQGFSGTKDITFDIVPDISNENLFQVNAASSYTVDTSGNLTNYNTNPVTVTYTDPTTGASKTLSSSYYKVSTDGCKTPGSGTILVTGTDLGTSRSIPVTVQGDLSNATIKNLDESYDYQGSSSRITPTVAVYYGSQLLTEGADYTLTYGNNNTAGKDAGKVTVAAGTNTYYINSKTDTFDIVYNLANATVEGLDSSYSYTGSKITPDCTVSCAGTALTENTHYDVTYGKNTSTGQGTITYKPAQGADYVVGTKTVTFRIAGIAIEQVNVTLTTDKTAAVGVAGPNSVEATYTGDVIRPDVQVEVQGKKLTEGTDYKITYGENTNVSGNGDETYYTVNKNYVTITGTGNYEGSVTIPLIIRPADIDKANFTVKDATYAGGKGVTPAMTVVYGNHTLKEGTDYTYELHNNEQVSTKGAEAVFTGTGNFEGTHTEKFSVLAVNLNSSVVSIENASAVYTGQEIDLDSINLEVKCPVGDGTYYTLIRGKDYRLEKDSIATKIIEQGTYVLKVTAAPTQNSFTGSRSVTFTVTARPLTDENLIKVEVVGGLDQAYTGTAVTPKVTVTDVGLNKTLVEGTDYTLDYANNIQAAGTNSTPAPTIKINGKGNYGETREVTFNIGTDLAKTELRLDNRSDNTTTFTYNGKQQVPTYNVYLKGGGTNGKDLLLKEGTDYEISIPDKGPSVGTKTITATGKGKYYGTVSGSYQIVEKVADATAIRVELAMDRSGGDYVTTYTGEAQEPTVKVYDTQIAAETALKEGVDYDVTWENNINANGTAYAIVTLKGNYDARLSIVRTPFIIQPKDISKDFGIEFLDMPSNGFYKYADGVEVEPLIQVELNNAKDANMVLSSGDYDLTFENNDKAGTATVTATGKGNFTGSVSKDFIIKADLTEADVTVEKQFRTGKKILPAVEAYCGGNQLKQGTDYILTSSSSDGFTNQGTVTLSAAASSYYYNSKTVEFDIVFDTDLLEITGIADEYVYTGKAIQPQVKVSMPSGETLDFDATKVTYVDAKGGDNLTDIGTITVTVPVETGGDTVNLTAQYEIVPKNINACDISRLQNNTYTGKPLKSPVVIVYNGNELVEGSNYTVTYSNNTNPGTASVVVTGKGNYTGTTTLHFLINSPDMVGLQAQPASTSSIKLSWMKNGVATGYQIYSGDGRTLYGTTAGTSYTIKGLAAQTEYTFRVRSYVTAGGTTTYGAFKTVSSYTQVGGIAVKVESTAKGKATLSWDKNTSVGGYEIYRSTSKNGTYSKVAVIPTNAQTSYTEKGLTSGKTYYYKMRAYKKMGGSYVYGSLSNALSVTVK